MRLHRRLAQRRRRGQLGVAQPARDQPEHLELARGQRHTAGAPGTRRTRREPLHQPPGGEMHDHVVRGVDTAVQCVAVADVGLDQLVLRVPTMRRDIGFFAPTWIKRIKVINNSNVPVAGQQPIDEMTADEASAAGNESFHSAYRARAAALRTWRKERRAAHKSALVCRPALEPQVIAEIISVDARESIGSTGR